MEDKHLVRVWNVTLKSGKKVRVATIEQGPRKTSMCEGCEAPCCMGLFRPILTSEEFLSKRFPVTLIPPEPWLKKKVPRADYVAALAFHEKSHCSYFDVETRKCTIWPNCPKACLAYDCREDTREPIRSFAKRRMKKWREL